MIDTFEYFMDHYTKLNNLTLNSIEQFTMSQLKAFEENVKIGFYSLTSASEIEDLGSLQTYMEDQTAITQYVTDSTVGEVKEIAELGESYASEAKEIVGKIIPSV
jgi:phasin family protein